MAKKTDDERLVNAGQTVLTKAFGEVLVKEFSFRQLNGIVRAVVRVFQQLQLAGAAEEQDQDQDMGVWLLDHLDNVDVADSIAEIMGAAIGKSKEEMDIGLTDGLALLSAIIEENDWEQIKKLFFQIRAHLGAGIK